MADVGKEESCQENGYEVLQFGLYSRMQRPGMTKRIQFADADY